MRPSPVPQTWPRLVIAAAAFGTLCRLAQWVWNTSLWHDEAFVALNVLGRTFGQLLGPLDWDEAAPPGFLAAEKLAATVLGSSEYALRLLPLLAGLAGLWAFVALARRVSGTGQAALFAALLMAASPKLVVQANEVKHFTLDLLFAVLLTRLALAALEVPGPARALLSWGALGAAGLWLSYASLFVFAGTSLALLMRARAFPRAARAAWAAANAAVLLSFALLLGPIGAQRSGRLASFWTASTPDASGPLALASWLGRAVVALFDYCWQPYGLALLVLGVAGGFLLVRTGRSATLLCLSLPAGVSLVASFLHFWPFGGNQHMVFAAPAVLLLSAEGLEALRLRLDAWRPRAGLLAVLAVFGYRVPNAAWQVAAPRLRHEVRPAARFYEANARPGDAVLCFDDATYGFYLGRAPGLPAAEPASDQRVWVLTLRNARRPETASGLETIQRLDGLRPRLLSREEFGAAATLWGPERR
jgi:hypothetical protein